MRQWSNPMVVLCTEIESLADSSISDGFHIIDDEERHKNVMQVKYEIYVGWVEP